MSIGASGGGDAMPTKKGPRVKEAQHTGAEQERTQHLRELLERAQAGDQGCLPELRAVLAANSAVWREYGELGRALEEQLVRLAAGDDLLLQESLRRQVEERRRELAGACPS